MIEFEAVGKIYRNGASAISDLSLTAPADQITAIAGPSGSGKTTALRLINRLVEPTRGKISWEGSPVRSRRKTALRRQMGYVSQRGGLFPHRTAVENIQTVPGLLGWSQDKAHKRSYELLARVGLERSLAHRYPAQLTVSQQQRVAIARALAADPKVLLLDEPFAALDSLARSELHEFLISLQRQTAKTIVLVTDDVDEALKLGDQVAILRVGGRLAQVGTPQHLLDEPADAFVDGYLGRDRGYRSLSFVAARELALDRIKVVREVDAAVGGEPTLMVDSEARPIGWADREHPGQVFPLGSTFHHESDSLRVALDSALSSPFSLAVAVDRGTGRFAGIASAQAILDQVKAARVAAAESISVRDAAAQRPDLPVMAADPAPNAPEAETVQTDDSPDDSPDARVDDSAGDTVETKAEPEPAEPEERPAAQADDPAAAAPTTAEGDVDPAPAPVSESAGASVAPVAIPPATATGEVREVDEANVTTRIERAVDRTGRPTHGSSVAPAKPLEPARPVEPAEAAPYPYDQSEYATEGGHGDSADDAANADDPESRSDVDLDLERDLDFAEDRDPVR